jgi:hypothetical protein
MNAECHTPHLAAAENRRSVCVKLSRMLDIAQALSDIPCVGQLFVISVQGECKEVLLQISCVSGQRDHAVFHCMNVKLGTDSRFSFMVEEERSVECKLTFTLRVYLSEPGASLLKAGALCLSHARYGMEKLTSEQSPVQVGLLPAGFPGAHVCSRVGLRIQLTRTEGTHGLDTAGQHDRAQLPRICGRVAQTTPPTRRRRHVSISHHNGRREKSQSQM